MRNAHLSECGSGKPSSSQVICGVGFPAAEHLILTAAPGRSVCSINRYSNWGWESAKKNMFIEIYFLLKHIAFILSTNTSEPKLCGGLTHVQVSFYKALIYSLVFPLYSRYPQFVAGCAKRGT